MLSPTEVGRGGGSRTSIVRSCFCKLSISVYMEKISSTGGRRGVFCSDHYSLLAKSFIAFSVATRSFAVTSIFIPFDWLLAESRPVLKAFSGGSNFFFHHRIVVLSKQNTCQFHIFHPKDLSKFWKSHFFQVLYFSSQLSFRILKNFCFRFFIPRTFQNSEKVIFSNLHIFHPKDLSEFWKSFFPSFIFFIPRSFQNSEKLVFHIFHPKYLSEFWKFCFIFFIPRTFQNSEKSHFSNLHIFHPKDLLEF